MFQRQIRLVVDHNAQILGYDVSIPHELAEVLGRSNGHVGLQFQTEFGLLVVEDTTNLDSLRSLVFEHVGQSRHLGLRLLGAPTDAFVQEQGGLDAQLPSWDHDERQGRFDIRTRLPERRHGGSGRDGIATSAADLLSSLPPNSRTGLHGHPGKQIIGNVANVLLGLDADALPGEERIRKGGQHGDQIRQGLARPGASRHDDAHVPDAGVALDQLLQRVRRIFAAHHAPLLIVQGSQHGVDGLEGIDLDRRGELVVERVEPILQPPGRAQPPPAEALHLAPVDVPAVGRSGGPVGAGRHPIGQLVSIPLGQEVILRRYGPPQQCLQFIETHG